MEILIIEDEVNVSSFVKQGLEESGYQVNTAFDGAGGLLCLQETASDLVILDVVLPDMNGFDLCRELRRKYGHSHKILMLTALNTTDHVVKGLDVGADDYLGKPFSFKELLARINALTRRGQADDLSVVKRYHDVALNQDTREVTRCGDKILLTPKEYTLLLFFLNNPERVIDRTELLKHVWEVDFDMGTNVVDVYVNYLRNKIDRFFDTKLIHTIVGMGYIMTNNDDQHQT